MHNSTLGLERTRMNKGIGTHPSNPPRPYARAFDKEVCSKGVFWFLGKNGLVEFIKAQGKSPNQPLDVS